MFAGFQKDLPWTDCADGKEWHTPNCYSIKLARDCRQQQYDQNSSLAWTWYNGSCTDMTTYCIQHGFEGGIDHGTITAKIGNQKFEITSLRRDLIPDGRHSKVEFCESWYEDASRRDFTINSIYSDINGNLYDPFNGRQDLKNQSIKFIGDPEKRIQEDYLRILRYIRFFFK